MSRTQIRLSDIYATGTQDGFVATVQAGSLVYAEPLASDPGGLDTAVQFNDAGFLGGDETKFAFNKTTGQVTLAGSIRFPPGATRLLIVDPATDVDGNGTDIAILAGDGDGAGSGGNTSLDTGGGAGDNGAQQNLYIGTSNATAIYFGRTGKPIHFQGDFVSPFYFNGDANTDYALTVTSPTADRAGSNLYVQSGGPTGSFPAGNTYLDTNSDGAPSGSVYVGAQNCSHLYLGYASTDVTVSGSAIGFYGVTPIARQSSAAVTTVAQLKTLLINLGLVS